MVTSRARLFDEKLLVLHISTSFFLVNVKMIYKSLGVSIDDNSSGCNLVLVSRPLKVKQKLRGFHMNISSIQSIELMLGSQIISV